MGLGENEMMTAGFGLNTVVLDGSSSWAGCDPDEPDCYAEEYIVGCEWDLDGNTDSDEMQKQRW